MEYEIRDGSEIGRTETDLGLLVARVRLEVRPEGGRAWILLLTEEGEEEWKTFALRESLYRTSTDTVGDGVELEDGEIVPAFYLGNDYGIEVEEGGYSLLYGYELGLSPSEAKELALEIVTDSPDGRILGILAGVVVEAFANSERWIDSALNR